MNNEKLQDRIKAVVDAMGFEYVGCEFQQQPRRSVLRIYVDAEGGISLDSCAEVSRQVGSVLDVEDILQGAYSLEVSSPGLDRPLFKIEDYRRFIGKVIKMKTRFPIEGRRNFKGVLQAVDDNNCIVLQLEVNEQVSLAFNEVERAKLVPEF